MSARRIDGFDIKVENNSLTLSNPSDRAHSFASCALLTPDEGLLAGSKLNGILLLLASQQTASGRFRRDDPIEAEKRSRRGIRPLTGAQRISEFGVKS